jgi:hypothetical protein
MEKRIKSRFSEAILHEALSRYGIANDPIEELDGFESFIYDHVFAQTEQGSIRSCKWNGFLIGLRPKKMAESGIMAKLHSS